MNRIVLEIESPHSAEKVLELVSAWEVEEDWKIVRAGQWRKSRLGWTLRWFGSARSYIEKVIKA
jgi:hypothetical protein